MFVALVVWVGSSLSLMISVLLGWLPAASLWIFGCVAVCAGLLLGVPASALYHLRLYRSLARTGRVPKHFAWRAMADHHRLAPRERRAMAPWFAASACGYALTLLGGTLCMLGLLRLQ